jgi:hypothetical protein
MDTAPNVSLPEVSFLPSLPGGDIATLALYLILIFYIIFTGILYYHWNAYATDTKVALTTYIVYFALTIPFIIIMVTSSLLI